MAQKTGALHYHAQLELPDKGRAIKEMVVCWVLPYFIPWVIERVGVVWTFTQSFAKPPRGHHHFIPEDYMIKVRVPVTIIYKMLQE